jgi:DNA-binding transcriptional LysR family regulator
MKLDLCYALLHGTTNPRLVPDPLFPCHGRGRLVVCRRPPTGISQPALRRHIRTAEAALGLPLFARTPQGLVPTDAGDTLLAPARTMQAAAADLALTAAGRETGIAGSVRITASRNVAHALLPPILARLRAAEPGIQIDLVASDASDNLLFGEADIAVRMYRPAQLDLVTRHVADLPLGLYAARRCLDKVGGPTDVAALMQLDFVGQDRDGLIIRVMHDAGFPVSRSFFGVRCDDPLTYWALVQAGCGVGGAQRIVGDADPRWLNASTCRCHCQSCRSG